MLLTRTPHIDLSTQKALMQWIEAEHLRVLYSKEEAEKMFGNGLGEEEFVDNCREVSRLTVECAHRRLSMPLGLCPTERMFIIRAWRTPSTSCSISL